DYRDHVVTDERFMRPAEVDLLVGDPSQAHSALGWKPEVDFANLVRMMVEADMDIVSRQGR
ncbi:MAG TPA: GDP-mannose 4,6-dehydratase, partial [Acidimicrobiales bacterium]|nr:GDP-mannose 4,6-dehydratase [Acidimicrobiales bacterium]